MQAPVSRTDTPALASRHGALERLSQSHVQRPRRADISEGVWVLDGNDFAKQGLLQLEFPSNSIHSTWARSPNKQAGIVAGLRQPASVGPCWSPPTAGSAGRSWTSDDARCSGSGGAARRVQAYVSRRPILALEMLEPRPTGRRTSAKKDGPLGLVSLHHDAVLPRWRFSTNPSWMQVRSGKLLRASRLIPKRSGDVADHTTFQFQVGQFDARQSRATGRAAAHPGGATALSCRRPPRRR